MCFIWIFFSWSWFAFLLMVSFAFLMKFYLSIFFLVRLTFLCIKDPKIANIFFIFFQNAVILSFIFRFVILLIRFCVYCMKEGFVFTFFPKRISCCSSISFWTTFLSLWNSFGTWTKINWPHMFQSISGFSTLPHWSIHLSFCQYCIFITSFEVRLAKSSNVFLLKNSLVILGLLCLDTNFRIGLLISKKERMLEFWLRFYWVFWKNCNT